MVTGHCRVEHNSGSVMRSSAGFAAMSIATGPQRPGQHGRVERMNARKTASIPKCTGSKIKECQGRTAKFSQKCMEVRESQTHGTSTRMSQIAILFIISRLIVRREPLFTPPNCTFSGKRRPGWAGASQSPPAPEWLSPGSRPGARFRSVDAGINGSAPGG